MFFTILQKRFARAQRINKHGEQPPLDRYVKCGLIITQKCRMNEIFVL